MYYNVNISFVFLYICVYKHTWGKIYHARQKGRKFRKSITTMTFMFTHTCLEGIVKQKHPGKHEIKRL